MALQSAPTLDPENRLPAQRYEYVVVTFDTADLDVTIPHSLRPVNPEEVMFTVARLSGASVVYQDLSATRKPWQRGHIFLRASVPVGAVLLLTLPTPDVALLDRAPIVPVVVAAPSTVVDKQRSFGITVDGGTTVLTTGLKGFIRVPIAGFIQKVTVLSTDAAVTSGSIVVDVWKDTFALYAPTVADTIVGASPPTLTAATASEDTVLAGWTRSFAAGSVFGFSIASVTSIKRVTVIVDYQPT